MVHIEFLWELFVFDVGLIDELDLG